ncbi:hypothetical protein CBR_g11019 [Chara braunii]|uniref:E2F/DP family winged-helix DNA-binding domain-containing protein n=1 Tax=Chara braunii TaxID=69332 RepID=A0A388KPW7_CHABU|nr:hypothetical protein CBR_g11019 [Chara braunii]|eukprot:GBG72085.1 hypothetical protein CBR_g11019 [Chara braunii]
MYEFAFAFAQGLYEMGELQDRDRLSPAYKLGKQKCSYNQVRLDFSMLGGQHADLSVAEAIESPVGNDLGERLRECSLKFNVRFSNNYRVRLYVVLVYSKAYCELSSNPVSCTTTRVPTLTQMGGAAGCCEEDVLSTSARRRFGGGGVHVLPLPASHSRTAGPGSGGVGGVGGVGAGGGGGIGCCAGGVDRPVVRLPYRWRAVSRSACQKQCTGPILRGLQRFGKVAKKKSGSKGSDSEEETWKEPKHLYIAIDEASSHISIDDPCKRNSPTKPNTRFRLAVAVFNDSDQIIGTAVSNPIHVVANNDAPKGVARITLQCLLNGGSGLQSSHVSDAYSALPLRHNFTTPLSACLDSSAPFTFSSQLSHPSPRTPSSALPSPCLPAFCNRSSQSFSATAPGADITARLLSSSTSFLQKEHMPVGPPPRPGMTVGESMAASYLLQMAERQMRRAKNEYVWCGSRLVSETLQRLKADVLAVQAVEQTEGACSVQDVTTLSSTDDQEEEITMDSNMNLREGETGGGGQSSQRQANYNHDMETVHGSRMQRRNKSLRALSERFVQLFLLDEERAVEWEYVVGKLLGVACDTQNLQTKARRLYDIANILGSLHLVTKLQIWPQAPNSMPRPAYKWLGARGVEQRLAMALELHSPKATGVSGVTYGAGVAVGPSKSHRNVDEQLLKEVVGNASYGSQRSLQHVEPWLGTIGCRGGMGSLKREREPSELTLEERVRKFQFRSSMACQTAEGNTNMNAVPSSCNAIPPNHVPPWSGDVFRGGGTANISPAIRHLGSLKRDREEVVLMEERLRKAPFGSSCESQLYHAASINQDDGLPSSSDTALPAVGPSLSMGLSINAEDNKRVRRFKGLGGGTLTTPVSANSESLYLVRRPGRAQELSMVHSPPLPSVAAATAVAACTSVDSRDCSFATSSSPRPERSSEGVGEISGHSEWRTGESLRFFNSDEAVEKSSYVTEQRRCSRNGAGSAEAMVNGQGSAAHVRGEFGLRLGLQCSDDQGQLQHMCPKSRAHRSNCCATSSGAKDALQEGTNDDSLVTVRSLLNKPDDALSLGLGFSSKRHLEQRPAGAGHSHMDLNGPFPAVPVLDTGREEEFAQQAGCTSSSNWPLANRLRTGLTTQRLNEVVEQRPGFMNDIVRYSNALRGALKSSRAPGGTGTNAADGIYLMDAVSSQERLQTIVKGDVGWANGHQDECKTREGCGWDLEASKRERERVQQRTAAIHATDSYEAAGDNLAIRLHSGDEMDTTMQPSEAAAECRRNSGVSPPHELVIRVPEVLARERRSPELESTNGQEVGRTFIDCNQPASDDCEGSN